MHKFILFLCCSVILVSCGNDIPFDSKKWKNAPFKGPDISLRWDMTNDLIENYDLKGKDTTEIFKLLGKENFDCFKHKCVVSYSLGPCRRGIDYGTLELTFIDGKVTEIFKHCN